MAVMIGVPGEKILAAFGVGDAKAAELKAAGIKAQMTPTKIVLSKGGEGLASVAIKAASVLDIVNGKAPMTQSLADEMAKAVDQALGGGIPSGAVAALQSASKAPGAAKSIPVSFKKTIDAQKAAASASTQSGFASGGVVSGPVMSPGAWDVFPIDQLQTAPLVKLIDATALYQPVSSSSAGSRYFLVAGNEKIKVGARWKSGTLSVRIEGTGMKELSSQLSDIGFDDPGSQSYVSLHLSIGADDALARKALGAILLGLGVPWRTAMPNLDVVKNKGV